MTALDTQDSATSGDPMLDLSERRGEVIISDRVGGRTWSVTIRLEAPASLPAEQP